MQWAEDSNFHLKMAHEGEKIMQIRTGVMVGGRKIFWECF